MALIESVPSNVVINKDVDWKTSPILLVSKAAASNADQPVALGNTLQMQMKCRLAM